MSIEALRETLSGLINSTSAIAALGAALDARVTGVELDAAIAPHVDEVVIALGARSALQTATVAELRPLLGEVRTMTSTHARLLCGVSRAAGWSHTDDTLLQAAGDVSTAFPSVLKKAVAPKLEGLVPRLESPSGSFLDVGTGVAAMSIEMARLWPTLRVVGIDPWAPALELARHQVHAAGLGDRIELREQAAEALPDVDTFDLAWIPSLFVPERAIAAAVARVHRALRPGGWLLFAVMRPGAEPLRAALTRLRTALFGGLMTTPETAATLLQQSGFDPVTVLPGSPTSSVAVVAARRP
jgi:SAM-dependent methyltransferase